MSDHRRKRPSLLLLMVCAAAGGALYLQTEGRLYVPQTPPQRAVERQPVAQEPLVINVTFPPLAFFDEIVERPLFAETRMPPPPKAAPQPEAPPPPPPPERDLFTLLGVAISDSNRIAIVRLKKTGEINQLVVGDQLSGWSLSEIGAKSVLFVSGSHENLVELQGVSSSSQPAAPPTPAAAGKLPRRPAPAHANGATPPPPPAPPALPSRTSAAR